ncbi:VOC family protein [Nocardia inohanensis]|uniref:VOC family protein n=1 Tax=Nocardia inohanensis TaxID=209246 RepID=UPI00082C005C|nr:VOC family protein [Nocardia inohanensis]
MPVDTTTHLNFRGDARAALQFYRSVFGGDLAVITYREAGAGQNPAEADQVMWGQVVSSNGFRVMAYDAPARLPWSRGDTSFFVSVRGREPEEITQYWKRLSEGATVLQQLAHAPRAPLYGMLTGRFGVTWVLDAVGDHDGS